MRGLFWNRYLLAGNATRAVRNLYRLSKHSSSKIRQHVAENEAAPKGLLKLLALDVDPEVRIAVALNTHTDIETLTQLSKDESPDVRFRIASASYMPVAVLLSLALDSNPYVRDRAHKTIVRLDEASKKKVNNS